MSGGQRFNIGCAGLHSALPGRAMAALKGCATGAPGVTCFAGGTLAGNEHDRRQVRRARRPRRAMVWTSARPVHAVFHRDVGALQLLRHARAARALHDRAGGGGQRRPRHDGRHGDYDLRAVHVLRLRAGSARGVDRRPPDRATPGRARRRRDHRGWSLHVGGARALNVLPGLDPGRSRHGSAQAERQRHCRRSLSRGGRPTRRRFLDLLHGDQHRRLVGHDGLSVPGRKDQLAPGVQRSWHRDDPRSASVRVGRKAPGDGGGASRATPKSRRFVLRRGEPSSSASPRSRRSPWP